MFSCGTTDPGTAARASRKSSTSAVRMEVSWRHAHRESSTGLSAGGADGGCGGCDGDPPASVVSDAEVLVVIRAPRGSVSGAIVFVGWSSHRHLEPGDD